MQETINVHEAKTHLSRLLDRVQAGEEIVLAKAGKPVARLVPLAAELARRQPGRLQQPGAKVDAAFFDPLPAKELDAWDGA